MSLLFGNLFYLRVLQFLLPIFQKLCYYGIHYFILNGLKCHHIENLILVAKKVICLNSDQGILCFNKVNRTISKANNIRRRKLYKQKQ